MKKVKVLHFFGRMDIGGAETFVINLFRNINREKIHFEFAVLNSEKGYYDDEINQLGGKIHILPSPKKNFNKYKEQVMKIIVKNEIDVVHSHVHFFQVLTSV
ncbi:hypothetical protein CAI16_14985 [Virgibacillus dokdonensis]|uniref:Glycosyltransferase subfamily 4-like N-terminal domain-containing protein n=1 Tax=Virgibacillus dokdonensis TaxID=302167 RepID=A0A3E0WLU0_9BACI|nr:hypothetical protein [Virgibacillus dokdonensis]RFA33379.1 hypothetical protein CAI16_14985 [Virgibacillus dokdonensis]